MALITYPPQTSNRLTQTDAKGFQSNALVIGPNLRQNKFQTIQNKIAQQNFKFSWAHLQSIFNTMQKLKEESPPSLLTRKLRVVSSTPCETHITIGPTDWRIYLQRPIVDSIGGGSKEFSVACCMRIDRDSDEVIVTDTGRLTSRSEDAVESIIEEATFTRRLHHPNIHQHTECHTYVNEAKQTVVVIYTPLCKDVEPTHARTPRVNTAAALHFLESMLDVLVYLQNKNIAHGDLKLANILMAEAPNAPLQFKLTDFGLANCEIIGLTANSPPEVFLKRLDLMAPDYISQPGYQTDMWALGSTLYHFYAGKDLPWGPLTGIKHWLEQITLEMPIRIWEENSAATEANKVLTSLSRSIDEVSDRDLPFDGSTPLSFDAYLPALETLYKRISHLIPSEGLKKTLADVRKKVDDKLAQLIVTYSQQQRKDLNPLEPIPYFVQELLTIEPNKRPLAKHLFPLLKDVHIYYKTATEGVNKAAVSSPLPIRRTPVAVTSEAESPHTEMTL